MCAVSEIGSDPKMTNREKAVTVALDNAISRLKHVDMPERCNILELQYENNEIHIELFGRQCCIMMPHLEVFYATDGKPVPPAYRVLVLHYLLCEQPVRPKGELISFWELPGGQFYWKPFLSRTVIPLVRKVGNDLDVLHEVLNRLKHVNVNIGDISASIHGIGKLWIMLIYRVGDEEFPPSAEIFFDSCIKNVICTEDCAVLAGNICYRLVSD